jgi:hypothetical protein
MKQKEEFITEEKVINTPAGGVLIGKEKEGQTIIHNDGSLGGFLIGRLHKDGGIKAVNKATGQPLEMQSNEIIITAPAVADTTKRNFEGKMMTNREILSKINSDGGGVSFADGGDIPAKIHTTDKEYEYGGKMVHDTDIAHNLGMNSTLKKGKQQFYSGGMTYDVDAIYNAIKKGKLRLKTKEVPTFAMKYPVYDKEYSETVKTDFRKPNGITVRTESGEDVLIDGNHRMDNAYLKGKKTMKTYYIEDPQQIAKFSKKSNFELGGENNDFQKLVEEKFSEGYGKLKHFELNSSGGKWSYFNNPNVTRSQRDKMPVYTVKLTNDVKDKATEIKKNYEISQPKEISILQFAEKFAKNNNGEIYHKSKSGSVYVRVKDKEIRISDHNILDRDSMNPKNRYDLEIIQRYFDEKTPSNLDYWTDEFKQGDLLVDDDNLDFHNKIYKILKIDNQQFEISVFENYKNKDSYLLPIKYLKEFKLANEEEVDFYNENVNRNNDSYKNGGHLSKGKSLKQIAEMHNVSLAHINEEFAKGLEVEKEHFTDFKERTRVAKDHLVENPNYYTLLSKAGLKRGGHIPKQDLAENSKKGDSPARDLNNYNDVMDLEADGAVGGDSGLAFADGGQVSELKIDDIFKIDSNNNYGGLLLYVPSEDNTYFFDNGAELKLIKLDSGGDEDYKLFSLSQAGEKVIVSIGNSSLQKMINENKLKKASFAKGGVVYDTTKPKVDKITIKSTRFDGSSSIYKGLRENIVGKEATNASYLLNLIQDYIGQNQIEEIDWISFYINDNKRGVIYIDLNKDKKNTVKNVNPKTGTTLDIKRVIDAIPYPSKNYDWTDFFEGASNKTVGKGKTVDRVNVIYFDNNGKDRIIQEVGNPIQLYNFLKKLHNDGKRYAEIQPSGNGIVEYPKSVNISTSVWQDILFVKPEKEAIESIMNTVAFSLFPKLDFAKFNNRYNTITNAKNSALKVLNKSDFTYKKIKVDGNTDLAKKVAEKLKEIGFTVSMGLQKKLSNNEIIFGLITDDKYVGWGEEDDFNDSSAKEIFGSDLGIGVSASSVSSTTNNASSNTNNATVSSKSNKPFDFSLTKINVSNDPDLSQKVQKRAFENGWEWESGGGKTIDYNNFNYLYFTKTSISSGNTASSFNNSPKREITEAEIFGVQTPSSTSKYKADKEVQSVLIKYGNGLELTALNEGHLLSMMQNIWDSNGKGLRRTVQIQPQGRISSLSVFKIVDLIENPTDEYEINPDKITLNEFRDKLSKDKDWYDDLDWSGFFVGSAGNSTAQGTTSSKTTLPIEDIFDSKIWIGDNVELRDKVIEKLIEIGIPIDTSVGDKTNISNVYIIIYGRDFVVWQGTIDWFEGINKKEIFPSNLGIDVNNLGSSTSNLSSTSTSATTSSKYTAGEIKLFKKIDAIIKDNSLNEVTLPITLWSQGADTMAFYVTDDDTGQLYSFRSYKLYLGAKKEDSDNFKSIELLEKYVDWKSSELATSVNTSSQSTSNVADFSESRLKMFFELKTIVDKDQLQVLPANIESKIEQDEIILDFVDTETGDVFSVKKGQKNVNPTNEESSKFLFDFIEFQNSYDSFARKKVNEMLISYVADRDKLYTTEFDKYENDLTKAKKDLEDLKKLLPSFQQTKFAPQRAIIIQEIKKLHNKITKEGFIFTNELMSSTNQLFTPQGFLKYYFDQTTQSPVQKLEPACNLPTPNGMESKLPLSAYFNVRTKQFKDWFGDWEKAYETNNYFDCSTAIDEETKEPKIFFHGVRKYVPNFGQFSNMGQGIVRPYGSFEPPTSFPASYFSDSEDYAKFYGGIAENMPKPSADYEPFIYKVFLSIKNKLNLVPLGFEASYKDVLDYLFVAYGIKKTPSANVLSRINNDMVGKHPVWVFVRNDISLLETIKEYGYDALIQIGDIPTFDKDGNPINDRNQSIKDEEFLTFYPNQVKSATVLKSFYFDFFKDIRFNKGGYVCI